ncbi:MAG: hypothetical protein GYA87_04750 [Christensenellaceae bacterium]|nr:hypothetical protein [Christensenellaceae bacterium]
MDYNYYNNAYNTEAESPKKANQFVGKVKNAWNNLWQKNKKADNVNEQYQPNYQAPNQYMDQMPYSPQQDEQFGDQQDYGSLRGGYRSRNTQYSSPMYDNQSYEQQTNYDNQYYNQYAPQQDYYSQQQYNPNTYNQGFNTSEQQMPFQTANSAQFATNNVVGFKSGEVVNDPNVIKIGVYALFESANCIDLIVQMQSSSLFFVNMENFADVDKIRSSKDIILGACYALNYTMICIGSSNMYLICPKTVAVNMNDATRGFLESIVSRKKTKSRYTANTDDAFDNGIDFNEETPTSQVRYGRRINFI